MTQVPNAEARAGSSTPTAGKWSRWKLLASATGAAVLASAGIYVVVNRPDDTAGPVGFDYRGDVRVTFDERKIDVPYTYGFIVMNSGDEDAVLQSVELVGDTHGITVGPASTAGVDRGFSVSTGSGYPPKIDVPVMPLQGAHVPAHTDTMPDGSPGLGVNIFVRLVVDKPGVYRFSGARLRYTVGGRKYTYIDPAEVVVCSAQCPEN